MGLKRKKIGLIFIVVFVLALIGLFTVKYLVDNKFETYVNNLPSHINLQYDDADFDIIYGNMTLENPSITIKGQVTDEINAQIAFKSIKIKDFGYWDFYRNDNIDLELVQLSQPKITYYHNKKVEGKSYDSFLNSEPNKTFTIKTFKIDQAEIEVFDVQNDSLLFSTENLNLQLSSIVSSASRASKLPFTFEDVLIASEKIKYRLNEFDDLFIESIEINPTDSKFLGLELKTKYLKEELSKHLKTERDHFDLSIASVEIKNQNLEFKNDAPVLFNANNVIIDALNLDVYRDKLVNDDLKHKSLYSKMLRELSFGLDLSEVVVKNGQITYEEKVKADKKAGKLEFSNLEASIKNVSNMKEDAEETTISISSNFMKATPLKVDWNFNVNDVNDRFIFKADLGLLKVEHLNQFMQPNLNIKLEGELIKTYFTIDGNANTSTIDLKTDYNQFDIVMLQDNGREKNKLLSGLINLFVSKSSKDETDNFRYSDTKTVERDKTKSVFNFVWKNTQAGLLSAMVGDGKKKN